MCVCIDRPARFLIRTCVYSFNPFNFEIRIFIEKTNLNELYDFRLSTLATKLEFLKDDETGELKGYEEVSLENRDCKREHDEEFKFYEKATNANSLSLQRMPAIDRNVRGNSEFFPFKPAALKMKMERELYFEKLAGTVDRPANDEKSTTKSDVIDFDNFLTKPDKFQSGLVNNQLPNEIKSMFAWSDEINDELLNDIDQFKKESEIRKRRKNDENEEQKRLRAAVVSISIKDYKEVNYYDTNFVKVLNTDEQITNFDELLPNPARRFPFELDTFQKKAILCLENKQNVLGKYSF